MEGETERDYSFVVHDWRALARMALLIPLVALCAYAVVAFLLALTMTPEAYQYVHPWLKVPKLVTMKQYQCTDFMWQEMPPACRLELARKVFGDDTGRLDTGGYSGGNSIQTAPGNNTIQTYSGPVKELHTDPPNGVTGQPNNTLGGSKADHGSQDFPDKK